MVESVDAGCMGHINKNDWCAVNKAPGRNRSRECILYWSVRTARAHAALLVTDGFLFRRVLPRQRGIQKKDRTNGLHRRDAENAPELAGSRKWHWAPCRSYYPGNIFAQTWQVGLTYEKEHSEIYCAASNHPPRCTRGTISKNGEGGILTQPLSPSCHVFSNLHDNRINTGAFYDLAYFNCFYCLIRLGPNSDRNRHQATQWML